jgi:hypothetical protein
MDVRFLRTRQDLFGNITEVIVDVADALFRFADEDRDPPVTRFRVLVSGIVDLTDQLLAPLDARFRVLVDRVLREPAHKDALFLIAFVGVFVFRIVFQPAHAGPDDLIARVAVDVAGPLFPRANERLHGLIAFRAMLVLFDSAYRLIFFRHRRVDEQNDCRQRNRQREEEEHALLPSSPFPG